MFYGRLIAVVLLFSLAGCGTMNDAPSGGSAAGEPFFFTSETADPGDSIMALAPRATGFESGESWIPVFIQGSLTSRLKKFSPFTVLERQYVNSIFAEMKKSESDFYSDTDYAELGKWSTARYILTGSVVKSGGGAYAVDLKITDAQTLRVAASFMDSAVSASGLASGSFLNEAAEALLKDMGVSLTETGRAALYKSSSGADIALARGIIARQSGSTFDALAAYYEAGFYNPSLKEAIDGLGSLLQEMSDVNLGETIRTDIQLRAKWKQLLDECAAYLKANPPFEIVYDSAPAQYGDVDFKAGTVNLKTTVALVPTAVFRALQSVEDGLAATGKKKDWGFDNFISGLQGLWPAFTVELTLNDAEGRVIGRASHSFSYVLDRERGGSAKSELILPRARAETIHFTGVPAGSLKGEVQVVLTRVIPAGGSLSGSVEKIQSFTLVDYLARLEMPPLDMTPVPGEDFLISREPVSGRLWTWIKVWAQDRGYVFLDEDIIPLLGGADLPVVLEKPEDAWIFCNAYNEYLGKSPVYFVSRDVPVNPDGGFLEGFKGIGRAFQSLAEDVPFRDAKAEKQFVYSDDEDGKLLLPDADQRAAAEAVLRPSAYVGQEFTGDGGLYRVGGGRAAKGFRLIMYAQ
jgi:hypothetical protein